MFGGQKGQVLLEVLIGVTILAVVMVALLQGFHAGIVGTKRVDERTAALNLAQSQMEYIKSQPYQAYDDEGDPVEGNGYDKIDEEEIPAGFTADDIEIAIANLGNETSPDVIQQVMITVTYDEEASVDLEGYNTVE